MGLETTRKKVIVIGAGFAGLSVVRKLRRTAVEITLIDQSNHHLFQPFLYQVATATFATTDIALPVRYILNKQKNVTVLMEKIVGIDKLNKVVITDNNNHYAYDYLVVATGARPSYFGHDNWALHAAGLKTLKDALFIREKILLAFEKAETAKTAKLKEECLTFVIIGAGPTGVEMASAVRELATYTLANEFTHIDPALAKVILIEANDRILGAFPERIAKIAQKKLQKMGVQVCNGEKVIQIEKEYVKLASREVRSHTIIWAAGVQASEASMWLNTPTEKAGRILVTWNLSLPGHPSIFAIGDTSACLDIKTGNYLPGLAAVAKQQGEYVAQAISKKLQHKEIKPFQYRNYGSLATIGRRYAIADFQKIQTGGPLTYVFWWVVHIYFLIGFRNRFSVFFKWLWSYFTFHRDARLIVQEPFSVDRAKHE